MNGLQVSEREVLKKQDQKPDCTDTVVEVESVKYRLAIDKMSTVRWYNESGQFHRKDGPAIEYLDGEKWWYQNGKLHCEDGPAMETSTGGRRWYLNGFEVSKQEVLERQFKESVCRNKIIEIDGQKYELVPIEFI